MSIGVLCLFAVAFGFVAGGLLGSLYHLVVNRPVRFEVLGSGGFEMVSGMITLVFAGPALLMSNAIRARLSGDRPAHWLALSTLLSAAWSFSIGLFLLNIYIAMRAGVVV